MKSPLKTNNDIQSFLKNAKSHKFILIMKMPSQTLVYTTAGWADVQAGKEVWDYPVAEFSRANLADKYREIVSDVRNEPLFSTATHIQILSADGHGDNDENEFADSHEGTDSLETESRIDNQ